MEVFITKKHKKHKEHTELSKSELELKLIKNFTEDDENSIMIKEFFKGLKKKKKKNIEKYDFGVKRKKIDKQENYDKLYIYSELLDRIYTHYGKIDNKKVSYKIEPPIINRQGNRTIIFENINSMCIKMNRPLNHLVNFITQELCIKKWSLDASNKLILQGTYQQSHFEKIITQYIRDFVKCKSCKSSDTILLKENRITFIKCNNCYSKYNSVVIEDIFI